MNSTAKERLFRALSWLLYAPFVVIGLAIIGFLLFICASFAYQYFDKFQTPAYAIYLPERIEANQAWLDSISEYSIDYRTNIKRPQGNMVLKFVINPKCTSAKLLQFRLDSNFILIENSVVLSDSKHGLVINDSLFGCDTSEVLLHNVQLWRSRIKFLRDTLKVGSIRSSDGEVYFQFGADFVLKKSQRIGYQCNDGIMYNELMIDENWKILRNCVTF